MKIIVVGIGLLVGCLVAIGDVEAAGELSRVLLPGKAAAAVADPSGINEMVMVLQRNRRSPEVDDYAGGEDEDGPEGRHLHKIKHKLKPHKFGHHHGGFLGNPYPAWGGGGYPGHGCRKLHGCGGGLGWHKPSHFGGGGGGWGGGPIAAAFAGPSPPLYGGGWNRPGYGFGGGGWNRPGAHSQAATWNLGPFQASFGLAQAG